MRPNSSRQARAASLAYSPSPSGNAISGRIARISLKPSANIASTAPSFNIPNFKVKHGDEVTIILTNHDKVEDLTHGFGIPDYDINFICNPQETHSVTFKADKVGAYWCYCTHFCHALHLEMRSLMLVEA